jgi:hypothetical protein
MAYETDQNQNTQPEIFSQTSDGKLVINEQDLQNIIDEIGTLKELVAIGACDVKSTEAKIFALELYLTTQLNALEPSVAQDAEFIAAAVLEIDNSNVLEDTPQIAALDDINDITDYIFELEEDGGDQGSRDDKGEQEQGSSSTGRTAQAEPTTEDLAGIEPAAGTSSQSSNSGYGFQSKYEPEPFLSLDDIGPLEESALQYQRPDFEVDSVAIIDSVASNSNIEADLPPLALQLGLNNSADNVVIKEDGSQFIAVTANVENARSNETLVLTLNGLDLDWDLTGTGWEATGVAGQYQIILAEGIINYAGGFTLKPPADSDLDLDALEVTASVNDSNGVSLLTKTDQFSVIVDAVVDAPNLTVGDLNVQYWHHLREYKVDLDIEAAVNDIDGSEEITKIIIDLTCPFTNQAGGFSTLADIGVTLNKGVEISEGIWEIPVNAQNTDTALDGLQMLLPGGGRNGGEQGTLMPIHQSRVGGHDVQIKVTAFAEEVNRASGNIELDFIDNQTNINDAVGFHFRITPLVFDMDGDGIEIIDSDKGVQFDMNNDGVLDRTSWVDGDDALLAIDTNKDGIINNQSELFGDSDLYEDGFAKLSSYDSNKDGKIDEQDEAYNDLLLWNDTSGDGISQANELSSLRDTGIASINLNVKEADFDIEDAQVILESTYTTTDGQDHQVVDALFSVELGIDDEIPLYSGEGVGKADAFLLMAAEKGIDVIHNFNADGDDVLDLSSIIQNFDATQQAIDNFIFANKVDGGTVLSIDLSGSGNAAEAVNFIALEGAQGIDIQALFESGNINIF